MTKIRPPAPSGARLTDKDPSAQMQKEPTETSATVDPRTVMDGNDDYFMDKMILSAKRRAERYQAELAAQQAKEGKAAAAQDRRPPEET